MKSLVFEGVERVFEGQSNQWRFFEETKSPVFEGVKKAPEHLEGHGTTCVQWRVFEHVFERLEGVLDLLEGHETTCV